MDFFSFWSRSFEVDGSVFFWISFAWFVVGYGICSGFRFIEIRSIRSLMRHFLTQGDIDKILANDATSIREAEKLAGIARKTAAAAEETVNARQNVFAGSAWLAKKLRFIAKKRYTDYLGNSPA